MTITKRLLPYDRKFVLFGAYDVLDEEGCQYDVDKEHKTITVQMAVYDNVSSFCIEVQAELPNTMLTVTMTQACEGLSKQGEERAVNYLADRIAQLVENELGQFKKVGLKQA